MRVIWDDEALGYIYLSEEIKRKVEEWVKSLSKKELEELKEYEETGDAIVCPTLDFNSEGGLVVKAVKHNGKFMLVAGVYGCGFGEEYYIGVLVQ